MKNNILAIVVTLFAGMILTAGSQSPQFSLRMHVEAGDQTRDERVIPVGLVDPDEIVRVHKIPVLTEKMLLNAVSTPDGGVLLGLNQAGKHSLETVTRTEMGKTLVVIINGRVLYAADIDMPMSSGKFLIPNGLDEADLTLMQSYLEQRQRY
ncbi:MAG: hypothetical protein AAF571_08210 [Verrucomicrobiota bacterium]